MLLEYATSSFRQHKVLPSHYLHITIVCRLNYHIFLHIITLQVDSNVIICLQYLQVESTVISSIHSLNQYTNCISQLLVDSNFIPSTYHNYRETQISYYLHIITACRPKYHTIKILQLHVDSTILIYTYQNSRQTRLFIFHISTAVFVRLTTPDTIRY